jgi:hypothetical protein
VITWYRLVASIPIPKSPQGSLSTRRGFDHVAFHGGGVGVGFAVGTSVGIAVGIGGVSVGKVVVALGTSARAMPAAGAAPGRKPVIASIANTPPIPTSVATTTAMTALVRSSMFQPLTGYAS